MIDELDLDYIEGFMERQKRREMANEIIEKVKKLRALAMSSEPHEAVAAYVRAQEFMKTHGISEDDPSIGPAPFSLNRFMKPMFPVSPYPVCGSDEPKGSKWTHFWDMHSGGGQKLPWHHVFIEAPKEQAKVIFYNRFDRNPEQVTCTCCGPDYSISEGDSLAELTAYHRGCTTVCINSPDARFPDIGEEMWVEHGDDERSYSKYQTLADYIAKHHRPELAEAKENPRALARRDDYDEDAILIIRASEIKPEEREGEVWR